MKILIIKFRHTGDVLLSTPLVDNLKYYYPDSTIDFALNKECVDVLSFHPSINKTIEYDRSRIKKLGIIAQLKEEIKFIINIRNHYDMVINLTEGDKGALLVLFSKAEIKLGFPIRKGILSKIKIFDYLGNDKKKQHTVEKDLQFINLLGKDINKKEVSIYWNNIINQEVNQILIDNNVEEFIHIHPVSRWMFKCWEDHRMAKIIDYLQQEKKLKVVITGAPIKKELDRINKIISHCKTVPINLSAQLTLKHIACLSSKAKLFFGVDTAPMHIAAATNTTVLTIFGASFPTIWGPWNNYNDGKLFHDIDAFQSNGKHFMISKMDHGIVYEESIKKSNGMVLIDFDSVKNALNAIL